MQTITLYAESLGGGKTFNVTTCQPWNSFFITLRQKTSVQSFKKAIFLGNQHSLNHFIV